MQKIPKSVKIPDLARVIIPTCNGTCSEPSESSKDKFTHTLTHVLLV